MYLKTVSEKTNRTTKAIRVGKMEYDAENSSVLRLFTVQEMQQGVSK